MGHTQSKYKFFFVRGFNRRKNEVHPEQNVFREVKNTVEELNLDVQVVETVQHDNFMSADQLAISNFFSAALPISSTVETCCTSNPSTVLINSNLSIPVLLLSENTCLKEHGKKCSMNSYKSLEPSDCFSYQINKGDRKISEVNPTTNDDKLPPLPINTRTNNSDKLSLSLFTVERWSKLPQTNVNNLLKHQSNNHDGESDNLSNMSSTNIKINTNNNERKKSMTFCSPFRRNKSSSYSSGESVITQVCFNNKQSVKSDLDSIEDFLTSISSPKSKNMAPDQKLSSKYLHDFVLKTSIDNVPACITAHSSICKIGIIPNLTLFTVHMNRNLGKEDCKDSELHGEKSLEARMLSECLHLVKRICQIDEFKRTNGAKINSSFIGGNTSAIRHTFQRYTIDNISIVGSQIFRPIYIFNYRFWISADPLCRKAFCSIEDRRIESIGRLSDCRIHLVPYLRMDQNGIYQQLVNVVAPNGLALKKCCMMFDDSFPAFNASSGLQLSYDELINMSTFYISDNRLKRRRLKSTRLKRSLRSNPYLSRF